MTCDYLRRCVTAFDKATKTVGEGVICCLVLTELKRKGYSDIAMHLERGEYDKANERIDELEKGEKNDE